MILGFMMRSHLFGFDFVGFSLGRPLAGADRGMVGKGLEAP